MWETWVWLLSWEDLLEKGMAIHSVLLPRKLHGWRSLVSYSPWGRKELDTTERLSTHSTKCAVLWAVVCSTRLCNITTSDFRKLSSPPRKPCTYKQSFPISSPASPWQSRINCLSLQICLFWTCHINGMYAAFCVHFSHLPLYLQGSSLL